MPGFRGRSYDYVTLAAREWQAVAKNGCMVVYVRLEAMT